MIEKVNPSHLDKIADKIDVGMMVEVPATCVHTDVFCKYADFVSIGTNDLMQYTMASDRMNEKVSYLYKPLNPSILKLIKMTIDGAQSFNDVIQVNVKSQIHTSRTTSFSIITTAY